jgi:hypothetical protein
MGGKSSSKSETINKITTTNTDKRQVLSEAALGVTADNSSVRIVNNSVAPTIVKDAMDTAVSGMVIGGSLAGDVATKAINAVSVADATNAAGFSNLLSLADKMFSKSGQLMVDSQQAALDKVAQISTVANDSRGAIDQKTIVILAAAGLGAAYLIGRGK